MGYRVYLTIYLKRDPFILVSNEGWPIKFISLEGLSLLNFHSKHLFDHIICGWQYNIREQNTLSP